MLKRLDTKARGHNLVNGIPPTCLTASADLLSITMNRTCFKLIKDGDACCPALGCELHIMSSHYVLRTGRKQP